MGVGALTANTDLTAAAQRYAEQMARDQFLSHVGRDGSTPDRRILAAGYHTVGAWGENVAEGQPTPAVVMASWIASPEHHVNLVNRLFRDIGVGYALDRHGVAWWCQDFGAGAGGPVPTPDPVPPPALGAPLLLGFLMSSDAPGWFTAIGYHLGGGASTLLVAGAAVPTRWTEPIPGGFHARFQVPAGVTGDLPIQVLRSDGVASNVVTLRVA